MQNIRVTYGEGFQVAKTPEQIRHEILRLEAEMMADPVNFDKTCSAFPVKHFRAPGMIGRQMLIGKGLPIIGKIHKHAHLNHISFGKVRVATEHGFMDIEGPYTFTSEPGTKRAVYALEDTLWTTFHLNPNELDPDNEDDMKKLEDEIIAKSYDDVPSLGCNKRLEVAA